MAALAAEEASSAAFLALGNASEAIRTKEKAARERDVRGAAKAAEREKQTAEHERKRAEKEANRTTERERKRVEVEANCTTWTVEDDVTFVSMITGGSGFAEIASALDKCLTTSAITAGGIEN